MREKGGGPGGHVAPTRADGLRLAGWPGCPVGEGLRQVYEDRRRLRLTAPMAAPRMNYIQ